MASASKHIIFDGSADLSMPADADTWLTPLYILGQLGTFDLDPCAAEQNPTRICARYFTKNECGLRSIWHGRVFMNPPFSDVRPWLLKHSHYGSGISLVPASVDSKVWRSSVWPRAKAVLLLHGRTRFCNPDGSTTTGRPLRSIALIAWSEDDALILKVSSLAGVFLDNWNQR